MTTEISITTVAHVIQLAVAPVFLLTGVGTVLNVMTTRLTRIIDRFRVLEALTPTPQEVLPRMREMSMLAQRERTIYWAISLCSFSALLVCVLIVTLFVGSLMGVQLTTAIAMLFIAAMLALIGGFLSLLREIYIATGSIHKVNNKE